MTQKGKQCNYLRKHQSYYFEMLIQGLAAKSASLTKAKAISELPRYFF